jgi:uncharacterized Rmd1/YagE family protein
MNKIELKAIVISNELSLNKIAEHFGIMKKLKWDDALVLSQKEIAKILSSGEDKYVYLFSFGSAVFIGFRYQEIYETVNYLRKLDKGLFEKWAQEDEYEIIIDSGTEGETISNDTILLPEIKPYHFLILSFVLAKSVALEKIEVDTENLSDELEELVKLLEKGELKLSDHYISKVWSRILGFKYNSISRLMLLDKPEYTWNDDEAETLYKKMSKLFELKFRYHVMTHKTEIFTDITEAFSGLSQVKKSHNLDWIIILLIIFEIGITLTEIFVKFIRSHVLF